MSREPTQEEFNFYFWLGQEGELTSITEEELQEKVAEERERIRRWTNVEDEGVGG